MDTPEFKRQLAKKQVELKTYINTVFPSRAGNMSLRFINGNFKAQGWQGSSFQKWKKNARNGTILVKSGRLRRGTTFTTTPGIAHVVNNVPYAGVHNRGFNGTVQVKSHKRRIYEANKVATGRLTKTGKAQMKTVHSLKGSAQVKAHTRKMKIPKRQFMPENMTDSPVLANAIRREIERELKTIFG